MITGKVKTLFTDKEKTEALFPRTKLSAVSDENGVGLDALMEHLAYTDEKSNDIIINTIDADSLNGIPAKDWAQKSFVTSEIAKAQFSGSGSGDINLDGFATKDDLSNIDFPVDSVNGKTGNVQLSAADVGAYSNKGRLDGNINTLSLDGTYWIETSKCTGTFPEEWGNYGFLHAFADYQKLVQYTDNGAGSSWERYYVNDKWYPWVLTGGAGKQDTITGAVSTLVSSNLNASIVPVSNANGKIVSSNITTTELGYLDGVTSNIQTQLNNGMHKYQGAYTGNIDVTTLNGVYSLHKSNYTGTVPDDIATYAFLEATNRVQKLTYYSSGKIYERFYTNNQWHSWKRVDSLNKIDKFTIPYGTPVDTGLTYAGCAVKCMAVALGAPINGAKAINTGVKGIIGIWANGNNNQTLPYQDGSVYVKITAVSDGIIVLESNTTAVSHWQCYAIIFYIW